MLGLPVGDTIIVVVLSVSPMFALHSRVSTNCLKLRTIVRLCARVPHCPLLSRAVGRHRPSFAKHPVLLQAVVCKTGFANNFFMDVTAVLHRPFSHRRQEMMQRVAFNEMVVNLEKGHVILVAGFQETCTRHTQGEVQP